MQVLHNPTIPKAVTFLNQNKEPTDWLARFTETDGKLVCLTLAIRVLFEVMVLFVLSETCWRQPEGFHWSCAGGGQGGPLVSARYRSSESSRNSQQIKGSLRSCSQVAVECEECDGSQDSRGGQATERERESEGEKYSFKLAQIQSLNIAS